MKWASNEVMNPNTKLYRDICSLERYKKIILYEFSVKKKKKKNVKG